MTPPAKPSPERRAATLVLGIGNILLRDEGVGVRVVEFLAGRPPQEDVELLDGGTAGFDLVDAIANRDRLIVVDAMDLHEEPGAVRRLRRSELDAALGERSLSVHEFGLLDTITLAEKLGCAPREVIIFGVQPSDLSTGLDLSPCVRDAVEQVAARIIEEIG